jgi:hypothetical protein
MDLTNVLDEIKAVLARLPELADYAKPGDPPLQLNLPAVLVYETAGSSSFQSFDSDEWEVVTIVVEVHQARKDMARAYQELRKVRNPIKRALLASYEASQFAGTVLQLGSASQQGTGGTGDPVRWTIGPASWNTIDTITLTIELDVTLQEEILE